MEGWPHASRRRRLLAIYLDFLLLGPLFHLAFWALDRYIPTIRSLELPLRLTGFAIIEWVMVDRFKWSPGNFALGIRLRPLSPLEAPIEPEAERFVPLVDPRLLAQERWWTILAGVLFVLDGAKVMTRWTQWTRPMPFFGVALDPASSAPVQVLVGAIEFAIGIGVLRLHPLAPPTGIAFHLLLAASTIMSWSLLGNWIAIDLAGRRAAQGRMVGPEEIRNMQVVFPVLAIAVNALAVVWMTLVWPRTRRARSPG